VLNTYDIIITAKSGGVTGQSGAIILALARACKKVDPEAGKLLRKEGLLTRDPRMVERKKPGRPKARKRFQYSKR
jgi:small subunit ribosomal protein S9